MKPKDSIEWSLVLRVLCSHNIQKSAYMLKKVRKYRKNALGMHHCDDGAK